MANEVVKNDSTMAERFTKKIESLFASGSGAQVQLTDYQRTLAQHYFIGIDRALSLAEDARQRNKKNQDPVPIT